MTTFFCYFHLLDKLFLMECPIPVYFPKQLFYLIYYFCTNYILPYFLLLLFQIFHLPLYVTILLVICFLCLLLLNILFHLQKNLHTHYSILIFLFLLKYLYHHSFLLQNMVLHLLHLLFLYIFLNIHLLFLLCYFLFHLFCYLLLYLLLLLIILRLHFLSLLYLNKIFHP